MRDEAVQTLGKSADAASPSTVTRSPACEPSAHQRASGVSEACPHLGQHMPYGEVARCYAPPSASKPISPPVRIRKSSGLSKTQRAHYGMTSVRCKTAQTMMTAPLRAMRDRKLDCKSAAA